MLDAIFDNGIEFHPETGEPVPWAFSEWGVRSGDGGQSVVARLRDDLRFSDGERVTATDVVTTMELVNQFPAGVQEPTSSYPTDVEATGRFEVTFQIDNPEPPEHFLKQEIVASHIWEPLLDGDEDDLRGYRPTEHGGPVGSGPFELVSADFEVADEPHVQAFELRARHRYPIPRDVSFLRNKGPFVRRVRVLVFETETDLVDAVETGSVDLGFGIGYQNESRFPAEDVHIGDEDGWNQICYNLRRPPLDDRPFRQMAATVFDHDAIRSRTNDVFVPGDLVMPAGASYFRPHDPGEGPVERFKRPELAAGELDVTAVRDALRAADERYHYTFDTVENDDVVTGDQEIRIDGELLTDVHDGPLVFLRNAEQFQPAVAPLWEQWVGDLQQVGIPIESEIIPFREQIQRAFRQVDFDVFEIGWTNISPDANHLNPIYHGDGEQGDPGEFRPNPLGYSGADSLIDDVESTFDPGDRRDEIADAVMRLYEDQPAMVTHYARTVQVLSGNWSGWIDGYGTNSGQFPLLNIRPGKGR